MAVILRTFIIMSDLKKKRKPGQHLTSDGYSYLTKRLLISRAKRAGRDAALQAMNLMGYVVTVKDGQIVKLYSNGAIVPMPEI